ncbi:MAG TPA: patatin-like phospholipase family protein [Ilumatobacteraceae bacterium]|nr:patatin-like phospholipase family protein [Ilumatobacteraceae bacterium]
MADQLPTSQAPASNTVRSARQSTPPPGVALCLSGGGYRAMLFHLGGLIRLNQLGLLRGLARVSSVSGGSITAAVLGLHWSSLTWDDHDRSPDLDALVIRPIFDFGGCSIDMRCILKGLLTPGRSVGHYIAREYDRHLFHGATLQDLPDHQHAPTFVINATNVQTGKLVRFSRDYMADYTLGMWRSPTITLANAVTASSAFPPFFSPHRLAPSGTYDEGGVPPLHGKEFRKRLALSDGGVYDNLGLQTALSACDTVLVSDGGAAMAAQVRQPSDWLRHTLRITEVIDSQVRDLRKRELIEDYKGGVRKGTYWSIVSDTDSYGLPDPLTFDHEPADYPANVPTRLTGLSERTRRDLVRWGYIICDTALRTWVVPGTPKPPPGDVPN